MEPVREDFEMAATTLEDRLSSSALRRNDIEVIVHTEILADPIPEGTNHKQAIEERIRDWQDHNGYSAFKKARRSPGKLVCATDLALRGEDGAQGVGNEELLSYLNLEEQKSVQREQERSAYAIEHAIASASPKNQEVLEKARLVVQPEDSLGEIARNINRQPAQVKRALDQARESICNPSRRVKRPAPVVQREVRPFNPPCVPRTAIMQTHQGAMLPIGREKRMAHGSERGGSPAYVDISALPRPRKAMSVDHPQFGHGVVLREREVDSGECRDVEFDDGRRRTILKESPLPRP